MSRPLNRTKTKNILKCECPFERIIINKRSWLHEIIIMIHYRLMVATSYEIYNKEVIFE